MEYGQSSICMAVVWWFGDYQIKYRYTFNMFPRCDVIRSCPLRIEFEGNITSMRCKEEMSCIWHCHMIGAWQFMWPYAVAKQRVAPNPFESPVAMMRRGFQCEAFIAKWNNSESYRIGLFPWGGVRAIPNYIAAWKQWLMTFCHIACFKFKNAWTFLLNSGSLVDKLSIKLNSLLE